MDRSPLIKSLTVRFGCVALKSRAQTERFSITYTLTNKITMTKILCAALVATGLALVAGCSDDGKKSDPKLAPGVQEDPRLKPAEAGGGGDPKGKVITPQGTKDQNVVTP